MDKKVITQKKPNLKEASELLKKSFRNNRIIDVFGRCEIDYEGRASSYLGLGDRLTILKPDGALLVHTKNKREPVNWQPPGSKYSTEIDKENNLFHIISKRRKPDEKLDIGFDKIYSISSFDAEDEEEIDLKRSEKEMGDLLMKKPWIIENNFKILEREKETELGYIDLFGEDEEGNKVIIELKRKKIGISSVSQLSRYYNSLESKFSDLRGIIMGPSLSQKAKNLLKEKELEFIELRPEACELGTDLKEFT